MDEKLGICLVLLGAIGTGEGVARAEESHPPRIRDGDRYNSQTHSGWTARVGTSVGYSDIAKERWSTLGAQVAIGYRLGPLAIEAEFERNRLLYYTGLDNELRGEMKRWGMSARFYFMQLGQWSAGKSQMLLFVDGAIGTQHGILEGRGFSRNDIGGGMGWLLEHRVDRPDVGVQRVGWHLGWRITGTPRASDDMARVVCKGKSCTMPPPTTLESKVDMGLVLGSSLALSW